LKPANEVTCPNCVPSTFVDEDTLMDSDKIRQSQSSGAAFDVKFCPIDAEMPADR